MSGVVPAIPRLKFTNATGVPVVSGSVAVYLAGTATLANTYQDKALTILNNNPVPLDGNGEAMFWLDPSLTYKFLLKDANNATVTGWPVDNILGGGNSPTLQQSYVDTFSGTGSQTVFTLSAAPGSVKDTNVYVGGVYQKKSAYNLAGSTLTFVSAPASGTNNIEVTYYVLLDFTGLAATIAGYSAAAAASASDAQTSALAASTSETNAAGSVTAINNRIYPGTYTTAPTTRPDGSARQAGDEYFNATANLRYTFNGTTWVASDINTANLAASNGASLIGIIQAGLGAVSRTLQTVLLEAYRSLKGQGAAGDGVTSDLTAIQNANIAQTGITKLLRVSDGTYVSNGTTITKPQTFMGDGGELLSTVNTTVGTLIIGDSANPTVQMDPVFLINMRFRWNVVPFDDNRATINGQNALVGIIGGYWKDTATLARISHINAGDQATCDDSLVLGATGKGIYNFGIEQIGSGYSRVIGLNLHNGGVQIGNHGIRWSGFVGYVKRGNVAVGNVIRDRSSSGGGLSIQANQENGVAVGNVFDNCPYGVLANLSAEYEGRHMLAGNMIGRATIDGANLNRVSGSFFEALIDSPTGVGLRFNTTSNGNRIDAIVHGGTGSMTNVGDSHLIDLLANSPSGEAVTFGASNSHARIVCRGTATVSQRVHITGSNNIIEVVDPNGNDPSIRLDAGANNNVLIINTTGNVRCAGDGNTIHGRTSGLLQVTGNNNRIRAAATTFSDTGTGNDFRGAPGASAQGSTTVTTSGGGVATITHGLAVTPRNVRGTIRDAGTAYVIGANAPGASTIGFTVRTSTTGAVVTATSVTIDWEACF